MSHFHVIDPTIISSHSSRLSLSSDPNIKLCQFHCRTVLVARGLAKVSVAPAACDWPKRIRETQHIDADELD
jgi:hypothetical protein